MRRRYVLCAALLLAACMPEDRSAEVDFDAAAVPVERPEAPRHVLDLHPARPTTLGLDSALLAGAFARAGQLPRLRCLLVGRHGEVRAERCFRGPGLSEFHNVKSASKSILSALVGIAIADGLLPGVDAPISSYFEEYLAADTATLRRQITIGNLLSMQSGLERTSGGNYGRWVTSSNWVRYAITRPMVAPPGGQRLYSTGNTHLLSAILTEVTGKSTYAFARDRLAGPLGIRLPGWPTDPQGIYFGGNDMRLTPRGMFRFGELYRNGGVFEGTRVVPEPWVRASLEPRTRSRRGEGYGYGWFIGEAGGYPMFYAWGYGGQFIFVIPDLELTVVTTSDPESPREGEHLREVRTLLDEWIVPAAVVGGAGRIGVE